MNPFDQLGGGLAQTMYYGQQCGFDNRPMELYGQQQQYSPQSICSHSNCPICKAEHEKKTELAKEAKRQSDYRKELYEERCKEYMKKHRVINRSVNIVVGQKEVL